MLANLALLISDNSHLRQEGMKYAVTGMEEEIDSVVQRKQSR